MLLVKGSFETGHLRHLTNHFFRVNKCYNKLPLLRREYLLSAVNGLIHICKILPFLRETLSN